MRGLCEASRAGSAKCFNHEKCCSATMWAKNLNIPRIASNRLEGIEMTESTTPIPLAATRVSNAKQITASMKSLSAYTLVR